MGDTRSERLADNFGADLAVSLRAWRLAPALPLLTLAFSLESSLAPRASWALWVHVPIFVFWLGWLGTQRIWYLRVFRRDALELGEIWRLSWALARRFVGLALLVAIGMLPLLAYVTFAVRDDFHGGLWDRTDVTILAIVTSAAIDLVLTFVTPALVFTTKRVGAAFRIGMRMLRAEWPKSAPYALLPAAVLGVGAFVRPVQPPDAGWVLIVMAALTALLNLWFKGATAAFYLRRADVGRDGSAYEEGPQPVSAPEPDVITVR